MATQKNAQGTAVPATTASPTTAPVSNPVPPPVSGAPSRVRSAAGLSAKLSAMAQGWSTVFPTGTSLPTVDGGYSQAEVVTQLNGWIALFPPVAEAKLSYRQAQGQLKAAEPAMRQQLSNLEVALKAYFGKGNPMLAKFGMKPEKTPAKPSPATAAAAVQRRANTRGLRNTMGPKQKAKVKFQGQLNTTVAVPADGQSGETTAAPAPAATSTSKQQ